MYNVGSKLKILEHYRGDAKENKAATVRWVKKQFKRPNLTSNSFRSILRSDSNGVLKVRKSKTHSKDRVGQYPQMEAQIREWLEETRKLGIPLQQYMLAEEGKIILEKLVPGHHDTEPHFKFSRTWQKKSL